MSTPPVDDAQAWDDARNVGGPDEVRDSVLDLLGFFDRLERDGDASIAELDRVMLRLKALPPRRDQLGHDLRLIAGGGRGADRAALVAAMARLRAAVQTV